MRDLEDADEVLLANGAIRGRLRVTMPTVLGTALMDAIIADFLPKYPDVRLQASISDRHVDLIVEGYDLALRVGNLTNPGLIGRPLGHTVMRLVASPAYLDKFGRPKEPKALLNGHNHICYLSANRRYPLLFADGTTLAPEGRLDVDGGSVMLRAALNDVGIAQLLHPVVAPYLRSGELEEIVPDFPLVRMPLHFLHAFARRAPIRARAFMDFVENRLAQEDR